MIGLAWSIDMLWPLIIVIPFWRLVIRPAFVSTYWDVSIFLFPFLYLALSMWRLGSFRPDRSVRSFPGIPISLSFSDFHSISISFLTLAPDPGVKSHHSTSSHRSFSSSVCSILPLLYQYT
ncbi:hypothetical protein BO83DRAFT_180126 [Aspergillus eucalypticola CBS 122712]|uniref:Uncharacterized protein n=1 Tax=Aspergillus eucalypticola (strain CBS 122712 / IBT 29274) TaxID=1448314 RepID=A0A317URA2_ASPEC|nr:uncharacterized protein BO83DRAFT_180126 [Aspergillus eucalypticola CBS 122712]PWY62952.1 hypothetical protein BO83DRAFT_180126 [Aspergillus eucalypticola CBS 122712]